MGRLQEHLSKVHGLRPGDVQGMSYIGDDIDLDEAHRNDHAEGYGSPPRPWQHTEDDLFLELDDEGDEAYADRFAEPEFDDLCREYRRWHRERTAIWNAEAEDWETQSVRVEHLDGTETVEQYDYGPSDMGMSDDDGVELLQRIATFLGIEVDDDEG